MRGWVVLKSKIRNQEKLIETSFAFRAKIWKYEGPAGWCFVTIPKSTAKRIRVIHQDSEEGWGRLKATVTIGGSSWNTSIWFDTKADSYLLPIKVAIRKKESLAIGKFLNGRLVLDVDRWMLRRI
jgi:hypothetical protein